MKTEQLSNSGFDFLVLERFPQPIAVAYRKMIVTDDWEQKTFKIISVFEVTVRIIAILVISQYLQDDRKQIGNVELNDVLRKKFIRGQVSLGTWVQIIFSTLSIYGNNRELFILKELYDWFWDTSETLHEKRQGNSDDYEKIVSIRNQLVHRKAPEENTWKPLSEELLMRLRKILVGFSFIENYDIVYISKEEGRLDNKYWYRYISLTGETPTPSDKLVHTDKPLIEGCYLSKKPNDFINIHRSRDILHLSPWLILWNEKEPAAAIFDGARRNNADYIVAGGSFVEKPIFESPTYTLHKALYEENEVEQQKEVWDVFISHAWEDKEDFVRPLANALKEKGLMVWFDEFTLRVGDSLIRSIDRGLANSKYGIVILSPSFFSKEWPQKELGGLISKEVDGSVVILPIWHKISAEQIRQYSPILADKVATKSGFGMETVVHDLLRAIR